MDDQEYFNLTMKGTNDTQSIDGSHHLIVESIKAIIQLDIDDYILSEIEMTVKYIKNDKVNKTHLVQLDSDDSGIDIMIDAKTIQKINEKGKNNKNVLKYLDKYCNKWNKDNQLLHELCNSIILDLYKAYGEKIKNISNCTLDEMLDDAFTLDDINKILEALKLPYEFQYTDYQWKINKKE